MKCETTALKKIGMIKKTLKKLQIKMEDNMKTSKDK